jgi:hypothetical protein
VLLDQQELRELLDQLALLELLEQELRGQPEFKEQLALPDSLLLSTITRQIQLHSLEFLLLEHCFGTMQLNFRLQL